MDAAMRRPFEGRIHNGDCIEGLRRLPAGVVSLAFADPPFNIGYAYDVYDDRQDGQDYLEWTRQWISEVSRVLTPNGTFWLAIGDEYAAEMKLIAQNDAGFTCRSWVVWYYTFGVNCKKKFSRSHVHLFHFVKNPQEFTFNDKEIRVPSARQLVYADSRANPDGRLPDDTWILRPQDCVDGFTPDEDSWYFPRIAGTFKERAGFHGCQMPEQLLGRIIRCCSNPGELVLDPFSGSATTLVVAKKLGRRWLGFELSDDYSKRGQARLDAVLVGEELKGAAEPLVSAPSTPGLPAPAGKRGAKSFVPAVRSLKEACIGNHAVESTESRSRREVSERASDDSRRSNRRSADPIAGLVEAFRKSNQGFSADRVIADPDLDRGYLDTCRKFGLAGQDADLNRGLFRLRKCGKLAHIPTVYRTEFNWTDYDQYIFASEIALRRMLDEGCRSLDELLCDPEQAKRFDQIAESWAPGFTALQYRWAALKVRKAAESARKRSELLNTIPLPRRQPISQIDFTRYLGTPGLYLVRSTSREVLYAGVTHDLGTRLRRQVADGQINSAWSEYADEPRDLHLSVIPIPSSVDVGTGTPSLQTQLFAHQSQLVSKFKPKLNYHLAVA